MTKWFVNEGASEQIGESVPTTRGSIRLYLLLTALLSSVFYAFIIRTGHAGGGRGAYAIGLMWAPGLAAILTCRLNRIPVGSLGWGWGPWRWQWLAYFIPFLYSALAYGIIWWRGYGGFPDPAYVAWVRRTFHWTAAPDWLVVCGAFAFTATTGMADSVAHALGEEIGWRGFLAPRMDETLGFLNGAILTGVIWTSWHLPILLFADYNSGTPWWFGMSGFAVMVISQSIIMAWLRQVSGSLWTGVVFHASHNLFIQSFFTPATAARGTITSYAIDEFGFAVPVATLLFAFALLIFLGKNQTSNPQSTRVRGMIP